MPRKPTGNPRGRPRHTAKADQSDVYRELVEQADAICRELTAAGKKPTEWNVARELRRRCPQFLEVPQDEFDRVDALIDETPFAELGSILQEVHERRLREFSKPAGTVRNYVTTARNQLRDQPVVPHANDKKKT